MEHNSGVTSPLTLRASAAAFMRRFMAAAAGRISALRTSCCRARIEIATLNLAFPLARRARCRRGCCFHGDGTAPR